ncbi:hypothetical protein GQ53DRAFT_815563 [Thozetella sp. PMI_491]|nr:hypothetical protein GQ53DRAFT_815563 [Thozetella sp. PMI_491]
MVHRSKTTAVEKKIDSLLEFLSAVHPSTSPQEHPARTEPVPRLHSSLGRHTSLIDTDSGLLKLSMERFKALSSHFPFVVIDPLLSPEELYHTKPLSALAIKTACAQGSLQERLAVEFRKSLAERLLVNGEKSRDILSSILVYLAWNHNYFDVRRQQLYQLSQIAVSMAVDLKIDQHAFFVGSSLALDPATPCEMSPGISDTIEKIRLYLGTYYVSTVICQSLRKPSHLRYTQNIGNLALVLVDLSDSSGDALIHAMIRVTKLAEEVSDFIDQHDGKRRMVQDIDTVRILATVRSMEHELDRVMISLPHQIQENTLIRMAQLHLKALLYEIGIYTPAHAWTWPSNQSCCDWCSSMVRKDIVISWIRAAQSYIEAYVTQPDTRLQRATLFEEVRLLYAVLAFSIVVAGRQTIKLDTASLRELADTERYLSLLERRLDGLASAADAAFGGTRELDIGYFSRMHQIMRHALSWYSQRTLTGRPFDENVGCEESPGVELSIIRLISVEPLLAASMPETRQGLVQEVLDEDAFGEDTGLWESVDFDHYVNFTAGESES